jgi:hypothetical protein
MKRYDGYEKAEAFTGEFESIQPGGYVCKILKVVSEEKPYGELLRIGFDIAEGEHKDFYKRQFDRKKEGNTEAKWPGMYYQTVKSGDDIKYFKGFITAIENSNSGFKWDWDEKKLTGKLFGGVFGQEEFKANDGNIKTSVKCMQVRSVDAIRENKFKVPDIKRLNNTGSNSGGGFSPVDDDDELPF